MIQNKIWKRIDNSLSLWAKTDIFLGLKVIQFESSYFEKEYKIMKKKNRVQKWIQDKEINKRNHKFLKANKYDE